MATTTTALWMVAISKVSSARGSKFNGRQIGLDGHHFTFSSTIRLSMHIFCAIGIQKKLEIPWSWSHITYALGQTSSTLSSGLQPRDLPTCVNNRHKEIRPQTKLPLHLHTHTKTPGDKQATCYWCRLQERQAKVRLDEYHPSPGNTRYECWVCTVPLCVTRGCFQLFHRFEKHYKMGWKRPIYQSCLSYIHTGS